LGRALLGAQGRQAIAGQVTLGGAMGLEGLTRPDLKTLTHTDDGHPIRKAAHVAQMIG
jgi:hypothetical protein